MSNSAVIERSVNTYIHRHTGTPTHHTNREHKNVQAYLKISGRSITVLVIQQNLLTEVPAAGREQLCTGDTKVRIM